MGDGWIEIELGNVCFTTSGGTPKRSNKEFYGGDIAWIKSGELNYSYIRSAEEYITDLALQKSSAKLFPKGTILIALYGATIGKLAILDIEASTNQAICGIHSSSFLETKFLFHYLLCKQRFLIGLGAGGAQPNISQTILKKLLVSIPPLPEQRAIVAKIEELFSSLDNGSANLEKAQEQLKVYRQAVLKKAFEGELTKEWREKQTDLPSAEELLEQIKVERENYYEQQLADWKVKVAEWEENGKEGKKPGKPKKLTVPEPPTEKHDRRKWDLPKEWLWTQVGSLCFITKLAGFEYTDYVNYTEDGDLFVIKAENAGPLGYRHKVYSKVRSHKVISLVRSQVYGGEILVVFVGAGTGNVATVPFDKKYFLGPNIGMGRPYFKINTRFLELFLQSSLGKNVMMSTVKAVAQPSLSMGSIRQSPIIFTSYQEQSQIIQEIESRLSVCDKVEESIKEGLQKAKALKQSILKKAFDGALLTEVELEACRKEADWEPAEVLLERIKSEKKK